jgi:hypothetical protein
MESGNVPAILSGEMCVKLAEPPAASPASDCRNAGSRVGAIDFGLPGDLHGGYRFPARAEIG